jgi:hypothetical protein
LEVRLLTFGIKVIDLNAKSQVLGFILQPTENTGQFDIIPNNSPVPELHAESGE